MPTEAEFTELMMNTTKEWTNINSVNGWKFTSKTDTSKYIFIPAAGRCDDGSVDWIGSDGYVWSSSLDTSYPSSARRFAFNSRNADTAGDYRYYGCCVRPVRNLPL